MLFKRLSCNQGLGRKMNSWEDKKLPPGQEKGTRFEIWLDELLHDHGYKPRRNVEFHKRRQGHRQVDILYKVVKQGRIYHALLEAKYSSNGTIPNKLRSPKDIKIGQNHPRKISTIVDDLIERYEFIARHFFRFDYVFLATNKDFDDEVKQLARKKMSDADIGDKEAVAEVEAPAPAKADSQPPSDMSDRSEYRPVRAGSARPGDSHSGFWILDSEFRILHKFSDCAWFLSSAVFQCVWRTFGWFSADRF